MLWARCILARTVLLGLGWLAVARPAGAEAAPVFAGMWGLQVAKDADRLAAECAHLRGELERTNAEISDLKRANRGVRDEYRLRKKMSEAEALARRLTEAEAELRRLRGPDPLPPPPITPPAAPDRHDAPAVLEAKADILSDQARRLVGQAQALDRAAAQMRTRQSLRRRAGQMERDPFSGLESSKRFMLVPGRARDRDLSAETKGTTRSTAEPSTQPPSDGTGSTSQPAGLAAPGSGATSGEGAAPPPPSSPESAPTSADDARSVAPETSLPNVSSPGGSGPSAPTSRMVLDPTAAAELRRLDSTGKPLSELERLERAAAALRARAQGLEAEARALRTRARP
jgi:hypothetical protein